VSDVDPLVKEMLDTRRHRRPLLVATALGIIVGLAVIMGLFLGALGSAVDGGAAHRHAWLGFIVVPVLACAVIAYVVSVVRRRR
jgi:hypothetical protein